jgi:predicted ATP-dependent endonuclease of OLD family
MFIRKITIKNFRSIRKEVLELDSKNMTILIGLNDAGKSNYLKALNLFFNNETELGIPFRFNIDFCKSAVVPQNKAKEVEISLVLSPPKHRFKDNKELIWTKIWRQDGFHPEGEEIRTVDKKSLGNTSKSKTVSWARKLSYRYVPAVKGSAYFSSVLKNLHAVLAETIEDELKSAGSDFILKIRSHTEDIYSEITNKLNLDSKINLPGDLSDIFQILDFDTSFQDGKVSLRQRGDGVQVRHLPIILRFIAETERKKGTYGSPSPDTIWGYEEPENNLEMTKAFELAKDFLEYSKDIQIFMTTHSPAFYSLVKQDSTILLGKIVPQNGTSIFSAVNPANANDIDDFMGILPIITPYVEEKNNELKNLERKISHVKLADNPTLYVEGSTDKKILELAIKHIDENLIKMFKIETDQSAGHSWVFDMVCAWVLSRNSSPVAGLFDMDKDAKKSKEALTDFLDKKQSRAHLAKAFSLEKPPHLISIFQKGIKLEWAIEEVLPPSVWRHAEEKGWLEDKSTNMELNSFSDQHTTFYQHCTNKGLSPDELLYMKRVRNVNKSDFLKYISSLKDKGEILEPFRPLIEKLKSHFKDKTKETDAMKEMLT